MPQVSVIMPAYNAEKTIESSIASVLNQSFSDWELLVINDGSNDATPALVEKYCLHDSRVKILNLPKNAGLPNARNQGCLMAKGNFIAFLDSDDTWSADKLKMQLDFHRREPGIEISHTDFLAFNESGVVKRSFKRWLEPLKQKQGFIYPGVCYKNPIGVLTVMASNRLLKEVGYFDTSLWTMEDQELWVRIAKAGYKFGYLDKVLAQYRLSSVGITSKVGKYKRAYKIFIKKMNASGDLNKALLYRQYYRHFGTVYFKKRAFSIARLYFLKSLQLKSSDLVAFSTLLYFFYCEANSIRAKFFSRI